MWSASLKARADDAVAFIFRQYGEEVYVRRLVDTDHDTTYDEDITRSEQEWRMIAVVNRQPSVRQLERYGRLEPVDLLATFSWRLVKDSGIPLNGMKTIRPGDILVVRGIRHTVVQVGPDGPKAAVVRETKTVDQETQFLEIPVMANITLHENVNISEFEQPSQPTVLTLALLLTTPRDVKATLSRACSLVGVPMKRIRISVNGTVVAQSSVVLTSPTLLTVTLAADVLAGDVVRFTYNPQGTRPVTHGIVATNNSEELLGVANAVVVVT